MNNKQAQELTNRAMQVIMSCNTMDQLNAAVRYSNLVYRQLSKHIGLVNSSNFIILIERSIGFAHCKILNVKTSTDGS